MSSLRSRVLDSMETSLNSITVFRQVEINRATAVELENVSLPCAFIYSGEDKPNTEENIIGCETFDWTVTVECIVPEETDTEDLLMRVHKELFTNKYFGGNAITSKRMNSATLVVATEGIKMLYIEYLITIRHKQGLPDED